MANGSLSAQLQTAVAAVVGTVAGIPSISGADPATLALLQQQVAAAQTLAAQVQAYWDNQVETVGAAANFAGGTPPSVMVANVNALLSAQAALSTAIDCNNRLIRLGINLQETIAPTAEAADIDHIFGEDIGVTATGDIGLVTAWLRTAQRVIRRICTPATDPLPQTTTLAVSPGDDLFRIAAAVYGDATAWALLAAANGLGDPLIQTDQVLAIPAYSAARANDGILPVPGSTA